MTRMDEFIRQMTLKEKAAACIPAASYVAASWDADTVREMGAGLGVK